MVIYHGSKEIVDSPYFGGGKKNNDFGLGFYCTEDENLAKEWAVTEVTDGILNKYELDIQYLKVLNLNSKDYSILNWIATLIKYRTFSLKNPVARRAKKYLVDNFSINVNAFDVIIGYRADDSYFDYAESFLNNGISVEQLYKAMKLGNLGEQIVIKSKFAFSKLKYIGYSEAKKDEYYLNRKLRNDIANETYLKMLAEENDGLYIQDIIRKGIKNEDTCLSRILCE